MNKKSKSNISTIERKVMNKINKGDAKMRPQLYYVFFATFSAVFLVFLGFVTTYFISIATLWTRIQMSQGPAYGAKQNMFNLIETFPWWALALGVLSLICMIYIVNKAGLFYKLRLAYLVPIIVVLFLAISFALSYSPVPRIFNTKQQNIRCVNGERNCGPPAVMRIRN